MEKLRTEDERIIQKKIDGKLSPREEEQFYERIKTSPEARRLFQRLSKLHEALEEDSKNIPPVDFSQEIMLQVNDRQKAQTIRFMPAHSKQLLAYAAVLLLGLFVGGLATYLGTDGKRPDNRDISGTMARTPETDFNYNENGTEIDIRDFEANGFHAALVSVNTRDSIDCTIQEPQNGPSDGSVKLLFSEGIFRKTETIDLEERYLCCGKIVFLVDKNNDFKTSNIRFIKEGKVICEFKPE